MGEITSISVDEELTAFVRQQVDDGRYPSESAVIEDALRMLKESEEAAIDAIRTAIEEGEASGEPETFDPDAFLAEIHRKHGR
ncbi:type II toxin-antitoxin system ParD family antitoxin [Neorhizobium sp. JUb45]|uniref:type II toxin-antitoxin system ParD family antitoxin n=1 Tax=unclassified Neorhizobium TaxID=2629175 RepID=UPI001051479F|nr:type II toxin-antitoxin system ParD family antitoxin [Neorhizobium sp. JUb45]TCR01228.1 antitoxin ParD1/3/4 [Neorhizobium sp. JUb45]